MSSPREMPDIAQLTEAYNFALYGHDDGIIKFELTTNQAIFWLEQNCYAKSFINIHYTSSSIIAKLTELTTDKNYHTAFLAHIALCRIHFNFKNSKQALLHFKKAREKLALFKRAKEIFNIQSELPTTQILIELHKLAAITPMCLAHEEFLQAAKLGDVDSALLLADYFRLNHFYEKAKESIVMHCKQAMNNALATRDHQLIFETKSRLNMFVNHSSDPSLFKILDESQIKELLNLITDSAHYSDSPRAEHKSEPEKVSKKALDEKFTALENILENQIQAEHQTEIDKLEPEFKDPLSTPAEIIKALADQLKTAAENKNEKRIEVVEERLLHYLKSLVDSQDETLVDIRKFLPKKHILFTNNIPGVITSRSKILFELMRHLAEHPRPSYQIHMNFLHMYEILVKSNVRLSDHDSDFLLELNIGTLKTLYFHPESKKDFTENIKTTFNNKLDPQRSDRAKNAVIQMQKYWQCEDDRTSIFPTYLKEQMRANFIPALHFYDEALENSTGMFGKQHVISRILVCTKLLCLTHDTAAATQACGLPANEIIKMRTHAEALLTRCKNPEDSIYKERSEENKKECIAFATWCAGVLLEAQYLNAKFDDKNNIDECLVQAIEDITHLKLKETIKQRLFQSFDNLGVNAKQIEEKLKVREKQTVVMREEKEVKEVKEVETTKETKTTTPLAKLTGIYPQLFGATSATSEHPSQLPSPPSPPREIKNS